MLLLGFFRCFLNTETVADVIFILWHFIVVFDSTPAQKKKKVQLQFKIYKTVINMKLLSENRYSVTPVCNANKKSKSGK